MKCLSQTEVDQLRYTINMKFLVILAIAVASAAADVSHIVKPVEVPASILKSYVKSDEYLAPIVKSGFDSQPEGHFNYNFETGNGIFTNSEGVVKNVNTDNPALEIRGSVKYTAPDGTPVSYEYVANEFGNTVVGSHIPVAPPIPELILRSLKYIEEHPAPVEHIVKKV